MAAGATYLKTQTQPTTATAKPKRRKPRETTISASASTPDLYPTHHRNLDPPTVVSAQSSSWCCSPVPHVPRPSTLTREPDPEDVTETGTSPSPESESALKIRSSPARVPPAMNFSSPPVNGNHESFPSSFSKFNSALTAGLLNPMSPPPPQPLPSDKARSSPTLFEMMASEPDCHPRSPNINHFTVSAARPPISPHDKQALIRQRISENLAAARSPGNQFNDPSSGDVKLTLSSKDGISVSIDVHRQILVAHSRFFAAKLSDRWSKQQRSLPHIVEIADCEDVEVYILALRLMYCKDLRRKLMREDVSRVLGILKVSAAIGFDAGVLSCLEFLEAAPWAEDEEEKVASLLSELRLEGVGAGEVLKRVSVEVIAGPEDGNDNEEVLLKLLNVVLEGKDEKARREMKGLVSKMLRENAGQSDIRKESLYSACNASLQVLRHHFLLAASSELQGASLIARQSDNLHWLLDILIDRQIAEDFLKTWASQSELADAHSKVPAIHRHEISRVTARLFVGVGKGQLLASKDARCMLVQTWLPAFYDDFGWMRRASKGLDRHLIEDGLSNTILTLPLVWQQEILLSWFDRFLNSGDDCPNLRRGFEVWWQRAFWRRNDDTVRPQQLRTVTSTIEN